MGDQVGAEQIQIIIALLVLAHGIGLFMFGLVWKRFDKMEKIGDRLNSHMTDKSAHGNGMPRLEAEVRIESVQETIEALSEQFHEFAKENRDAHKTMYERLERKNPQ